MKRLLLIPLTFISIFLMAQQNNHPKTVSVTANAEIKVNPDQVVYSININEKRTTFEEAYDALDKEINKAIDLLIMEKLKKEIIKTTAYNVQRNFIWKDGKRFDDGFMATSRLEAKDKLDTREINKVLARFAKGSPNLDLNIGFAISDELLEESNDQLLTDAVKRTRRKAQTICFALGRDLGEIDSVTYSEIGVSRPIVRQKNMVHTRTMAMEGSQHDSIENVKEVKLNLNVHSVWEIK